MKNYKALIPNTCYIHEDNVLSDIYERAVSKFMPVAGDRIVFVEVAQYIAKQLKWKKQCEYTHALPVLSEVCEKISEDFNAGVESIVPEAKCYRDIYYEIFY